MSEILPLYSTYRKVFDALSYDLAEFSIKRRLDVVLKGARLLGLYRGGKNFVIDNPDDFQILGDFCVYEWLDGDESLVELYRKEAGWKSELDEELLDAMISSSRTSLFRIASVLSEECTLVLEDLLRGNDDVRLIERALSATASPGLLIFTRLISLKRFNMTSGFGFAFGRGRELLLTKKYDRVAKKVDSDNEAVKRFVSFYRLSKTDGLKMAYFYPKGFRPD